MDSLWPGYRAVPVNETPSASISPDRTLPPEVLSCRGPANTDPIPRRGSPAGRRRALLPALLHPLAQLLQRRYDRHGRPRRPLHQPGRRHRRPAGRRGRSTPSRRRPGHGARPPRVRPPARIRNRVEDGGWKRRRAGSRPSPSAGPSPTSRAPSPPTSGMTGRPASARFDGPACVDLAPRRGRRCLASAAPSSIPP